MPIAVADTSPLNYLIRLGHPEILSELYSQVLVPAAVLQELVDDRDGREAARARNIPINGTLFVILEGSWRGYFPLTETLPRLREFGFRFSPRL